MNGDLNLKKSEMNGNAVTWKTASRLEFETFKGSIDHFLLQTAQCTLLIRDLDTMTCPICSPLQYIAEFLGFMMSPVDFDLAYALPW